jgi:Uri superfamily endonuclease
MAKSKTEMFKQWLVDFLEKYVEVNKHTDKQEFMDHVDITNHSSFWLDRDETVRSIFINFAFKSLLGKKIIRKKDKKSDQYWHVKFLTEPKKDEKNEQVFHSDFE